MVKVRSSSLKPLIVSDPATLSTSLAKEFSSKAPLEVEIGFGLGEVLIRLAQESPTKNFVGIEQHWERICRTLQTIARLKRNKKNADFLENIRIIPFDARLALSYMFVEQSIDQIYSFFPCPWPKKKHVHHRLFNRDFFVLANNRLKNSGAIKIVTDFGAYFEWILEEVKDTGFKATTKIVNPQYDTKFERKWRGKGQKEFFELTLQKEKHISVSLQGDPTVESYLLEKFNPAKFCFENVTGTISVILKDKIFDAIQEKFMAHLVVTEEHLTQHVWVMIRKDEKGWRVFKADGQKVFATAGVAKAIEFVYQAAQKTGNG